MIRVKVLGVGASSATMLVQDTDNSGKLSVLKRINVSSWSSEDILETQQLYASLMREKIQNMLVLQNVTLQDSFLSVLTPYYAKGDMETYLDAESRSPFDEVKVMQWMLDIANVIEHVHRVTGGCFYGLSLDRIFFCDNETGLHVGLPMPRVSYFKWLSERETLGVAVVREYPSEVLIRRHYDKKASDVWYLGLIGMKILGAHTSYFNRSKDVCALISFMMEPTLKKRPSISDVVLKLKELLAAKRTQQSLTSSLSSFFAPSIPLFKRIQPTAPSIDSSVDNGDNSKSTTTVGAENRSAAETRHAPSGGRTRHVLPPNWHTHALQQFEELQKLNAAKFYKKISDSSPVNNPSTSTTTTAATRQNRSLSAGTALSLPQDSQRASASLLSPRKRASVSSQGPRAASAFVRRVAPARQSRSLSTFRSANNSQEDSRRWFDVSRQDQEAKRLKKPELNIHRRHANGSNVERASKLPYKRDEKTKHDIRRHIMQWKEEQTAVKSDCSVIVNDEGDISVFFPKSSPQKPLSSLEQTSVKSNNKTNALVDTGSENKQETCNTRPLTPVRSLKSNIKIPPCGSPVRFASTYRERGISPRVPRTRANNCDSELTASQSKNLGERDKQLLPDKSSNVNDIINYGDEKELEFSSVLSTSKSTFNCLAKQSSDKDRKENSSVVNNGKNYGCVCVDVLDSLELSIKNLRLSISKLLKDKACYNKILKILDTFSATPVAERHGMRFNLLFMNTIKKVLIDEKLYLVVIPLCSQLIALQGLMGSFNKREN